MIFGQKDQSLYLLSNLESLSPEAPQFAALEDLLNQEEGNFTILILGDFVDQDGFEIEPSTEETAKLDRLIQLTKNKGKIIFVPGDLEWSHGKRKGWKKLLALEKYLESKMGKGEILMPQSACLGPQVEDIGKNLRFAAINSQWLVEKDNRPEQEDVSCGAFIGKEFWGEVEDILADTDNRNLVMAFHHPVLSYGQYAGYKLLGQHFSPPIYGSFKAAFRQNIGTSKDLSHPEFKNFSKLLLKIAERHPGAIFVTGHENDLQILYREGNYHINSGAFAVGKPVAKGDATIYRQKEPGFAKLSFEQDGTVSVTGFSYTNKSKLSISFERILFSNPCQNPRKGIPVNQLYNPCAEIRDTSANVTALDSGSAIASTRYKAGPLRRLIFGKNYRTTWSEPVQNIPYLDLKSMGDGLKPYATGGGAETLSLKFKSKDKRAFAFRQIDKNPTRRLAKDLKGSVYAGVTQEFTAIHQPYAGLIVASLQDELKIPHSMPKLYLMPDAPQLGPFREQFADSFGFLEEKPLGGKKNREGFKKADKVDNTFEMYRELLDDHDNRLDVQEYVASRIFDMLIGDWDRHEGNWKWLGYKTEDGTLYKPFPKDRDKAFYTLRGLMRLFEFDFIAKDIGTFRKKYGNIKSVNHKAKSMDRWLPASFTRSDWRAEATRIQTLLTDEVIDQAIAALPPEVQPLSGPEIKKKLKIRRDNLVKVTDKYYLMIAKYFDLVGSNKREYFEITRLENGDVAVQIYKLSKKGNKKEKLLDRTFIKGETKEIRLHGLGKRDEFHISGEASNSILIRIVSGDGVDIIEDQSKVKGIKKMTRIYDKRQKDQVTLNSEAKMVKTPEILTFKTDNVFNYNYLLLLPSFAYNLDDGYIVGVNGNYSRQGFNKPGFKSKLTYNASLTTKENYNLDLNWQQRHIFGKWDLTTGINTASNDRSFQHFYGLGNKTIRIDSLERIDYYENDSKIVQANLGVTREFWQKSFFTAVFQVDYRHITEDPDGGRDESIYDELPPGSGLGKATLFGPRMELHLDFTDNTVLPQRGMRLYVNNYSFINSEQDWKMGGRLETEMAAFITRGIKIPTTLSLRVGAIQAYGNTPFYYKSFIGQQSNHRGFLRNRFGGDQAAFLNSDLRFHFGKVITPLVPFKYGIFGLFDAGRVWVNNESSGDWHLAYGGGIYLIPDLVNFNLNFTVALNEEKQKLFSFRIGFFLQ